MKIKKMYNEILATSLLLNFFDSFLTALAVFSIIYFVMYFTRITHVIPIALSAMFFLWSLYRKIRENKILTLEKKYPSLRERLRTSYDNLNKNNIIVMALHQDILNIAKKVDVNAFLNIKRLSFKVIITCFMLFSTLYFSSIGLDVLDIKTRVVHSSFYKKIAESIDIKDEIKDRPLLKKPSLLDLGKKDMNFSVETYNTELDINNIEEPKKEDFGGYYPEEVEGAAQEAYESKIPDEYKETIKEYFDKINKK